MPCASLLMSNNHNHLPTQDMRPTAVLRLKHKTKNIDILTHGGELERLICDLRSALQQEPRGFQVARDDGGKERVLVIGSEGVYIPARIREPAVEYKGRLEVAIHFRRSFHEVLKLGDPRNTALYIDDFVNPPFITVRQANDSGIGNNPARVRSRNREETCVMECLDQVLKSLSGDDVMLLTGDGTTAEALIVDMAPVPEIHAESRATHAESIAFRVREDDVVEFRRHSASGQG
jgi:hypothetical protein